MTKPTRMEEMAEAYADNHVADGYTCCAECGHKAADRQQWVKTAFLAGFKAALDCDEVKALRQSIENFCNATGATFRMHIEGDNTDQFLKALDNFDALLAEVEK